MFSSLIDPITTLRTFCPELPKWHQNLGIKPQERLNTFQSVSCWRPPQRYKRPSKGFCCIHDLSVDCLTDQSPKSRTDLDLIVFFKHIMTFCLKVCNCKSSYPNLKYLHLGELFLPATSDNHLWSSLEFYQLFLIIKENKMIIYVYSYRNT